MQMESGKWLQMESDFKLQLQTSRRFLGKRSFHHILELSSIFSSIIFGQYVLKQILGIIYNSFVSKKNYCIMAELRQKFSYFEVKFASPWKPINE